MNIVGDDGGSAGGVAPVPTGYFSLAGPAAGAAPLLPAGASAAAVQAALAGWTAVHSMSVLWCWPVCGVAAGCTPPCPPSVRRVA